MPSQTDEEAALAAIGTLDELSEEQKAAKAKIDLLLNDENGAPFVDVHELFMLYNILYFRSMLLPRVEVSWSARLTMCAGICELVKDDNGKYTRIRLKLSEALLKYRPRSDMLNTLLHEAIHAYFFITTSWRHSRGDDGTGHGAGFLLMADAISNHGGYEITVFHTFHDEVDSYRTHIWQCDGPCRQQAPFFGLVKRSMNRTPGKSDPWWSKHEEECGGTYTKIAEPEMTKAKLASLSAKERAGRQKNKIDAWVKPGITGSEEQSKGVEISRASLANKPSVNSSSQPSSVDSSLAPVPLGSKRKRSFDLEEPPAVKKVLVTCPICAQKVDEATINAHLDESHDL